MDAEDGQAPVLIRVLALDAEPRGGAVRALARIDLGVTVTGVSLASPESWRCETSAAVCLGSLADPGMLRDLVEERPWPDAMAAFDANAWKIFTPELIGDMPIIDVRKVVRAVRPDLPPELEADPVALLAQAGGTPMMAATVPQPDLALARRVEATAMLLGLTLIGAALPQLQSDLSLSAISEPHGPDRGVRGRVAALVRLSALPPPPWPPALWYDETAWREVSAEELRRIASDAGASVDEVAQARAELARRRGA